MIKCMVDFDTETETEGGSGFRFQEESGDYDQTLNFGAENGSSQNFSQVVCLGLA